jgi:GGDEF domain-containing protein
MAQPKISQQELVKFSRVTVLLFNRVTVYSVNHPYTKETLDQFHQAVEQMLSSVSPIVLLLVHDQLSIDDEPLDPRINVGKIVTHFKKTGIQSISFDKGLDKNELRTFLEVITAVHKYPDADAMKKALTTKGVKAIKINHVFFKKVTADDEVVPIEVLRSLAPEMDEGVQFESKKLLIDMVLQSVLTEEFSKSFTVENLVQNPGILSKNLIEADLVSARSDVSGELRPGHVLMHQLGILDKELEENLSDGTGTELFRIADALFEMKRHLAQGVASQKSVDIVYVNEEAILDKVNEMTDRVLSRIVKEEYKASKTNIGRLAQVLRRLIPDVPELKRLMPQIKAALLEEGMSLPEYLKLISELARELQNEDLTRVLQESAEEIGIDGQTLIQEFKTNPSQAAELIFLAAEIRKGTGDERELTELLVEYVERLGSKLTVDIAKQDHAAGEGQLRRIVATIESSIVERLKKMEVQDDIIKRLEEKFNSRINELVDKVKLDWIRSMSGQQAEGIRTNLSVLQMLEQTVSESTELGEVIEVIRSKVEANEIDENDFSQLYTEMVKEQQRRAEGSRHIDTPIPVIPEYNLLFSLEKEIARARRYFTPLSVLAFALVKVKPRDGTPVESLSNQTLKTAICQRIFTIVRDSDIIGQMGTNKLLVLLPMTSHSGASTALQRCLKLIHSHPIEVDGISMDIKAAGVMMSFDQTFKGDAKAFFDFLSADLAHMETRIRNLQAYF